MLGDFYKQEESNVIWWVDDTEYIGRFLFSFDKKQIFNLFEDYPHNLTTKELEIFNRENPFWAEFFKDRLTDYEQRLLL